MVRRRLIDWKFLAMLTVMLLVMVACWGFVARQKQVDSLIQIGRQSTAQVRVLSDKIDAQDAAARASLAAAARQRKALKAQNAELQAQLAAIVAYLRDRGIAIPPSALQPRASGGGGGGSSHPKAPTSQTSPAPSPSHPGQGSPAPTPAPTAPSADLCALVPPLCSLL